MISNAVATVLYLTAFVTSAAAVQPTSWRQWDYNRRAAASVSTGDRGGPGAGAATLVTQGVCSSSSSSPVSR